jgi:large subunit ribosomal protein L18
MGATNKKVLARFRRKQSIRKKIAGTSTKPRLSVYRSNKHIYAQLIDDTSGRTIVAASTLDEAVRSASDPKNKRERSSLVGKLIGERALEKGCKQVVFDRNGFLYHGRIKAVSDGAREAGLKF